MKGKTKLDPMQVVWEITLKCNLKCSHCGSSAGIVRPDELTKKEALKLCDDLAEIGFKGIGLMGGELFLRKDWTDISKRIKNKDMALSIISNGYFNPKVIFPKLKEVKVDCFMIGFDGATAETHDKIRGVKGSFKKAKENLLLAKKKGFMTGAITTVHKQNFHELNDLKDFIIKNKIDWQIQMATVIGRFKEKLSLSQEEYYALGLFISKLQKDNSSEEFTITGAHNLGYHSNCIPNLSFYNEWHGCVAGIEVLGIQSNGDVKGCLAMSDDFIEGNIRKKSIIDIWNDPNSFSYSRNFSKEEIGDNCKSCKNHLYCKGGCTTRSNSLTGIPHNDPYCFYRFEKQKINS